VIQQRMVTARAPCASFLFVQLGANRVDEVGVELGEPVQVKFGCRGRFSRNYQVLLELFGQLVLLVFNELGGVECDLQEFIGQDVTRRSQLVEYF
jgi:hypothetical protein